MNLSSVQIALRPVLNDDVSGIISNYYFRNLHNERRKLLNSLHFELLEEVQKRLSTRMSVIDQLLYDPNLADYGFEAQKILLDDHDYFHNQLLETEMELFIKYRKI
jgi:hypothetical protein